MDIGLGELGITPTENDTCLIFNSYLGKASSNKSPKRKLDSKIDGIKTLMTEIIDLCAKDNEPVHKLAKKPAPELAELMLENFKFPELYTLIKQYKLHLNRLKDNDMCPRDNQLKIVSKIERIFDLMEDCSTRSSKSFVSR